MMVFVFYIILLFVVDLYVLVFWFVIVEVVDYGEIKDGVCVLGLLFGGILFC